MFASVCTTAAAGSLMLSSLMLENISQPHQELFTELVCWVIILLSGRFHLQYFSSSSRPFSTTGLSAIAFSATLLCLSSSIQKTTWYTAPLLSPVLTILGKDILLLPQHGKSRFQYQIANTGRKRIIFLCVFAAGTTTVLSQAETSYRLSLQICWLFAQIILYWGLFDRIPQSDGSPTDNLAEALQTITELAHLMVFVTTPLTVLWWQGIPVTPQIGLISLLKAIRWIAIFILCHEFKLSIPVWNIIFAVCTNSNWTHSQGWQTPITTIGAFIALYHIGTTFPQSSYGRWMTIVFALFPIWAIGAQNGLAVPSEARLNAPASMLTMQSHISKHPIQKLVEDATAMFAKMQLRQSRSLRDAIAEYKKRYGRLPPPGFDKWYQFAVKNDIQLVDEYDYLTKSLEPFWKVSPKILRNYVDQAISIDSTGLDVLVIKNHSATLNDPGFQHKQLIELIKPVVRFLPDIKAALNGCDEPRVLIPHDAFSGDAKQGSGQSTGQIQPIYFGEQDQQRIWETVTISCPPTSLARSALLEPPTSDFWPQFVSNLSDAQDICNFPASASTKHGFLSSPSTFHYTHSPVPILATAKLSPFQDIMIPSSYYFQDDISEYDESKDSPWEEKKDSVYWRGSGTGGRWTKGSWKMGHRQRFVNFTNSADAEISLLKQSSPPHWTAYRTKMSQVIDKFKVEFSNFIQCDTADCEEQGAFFHKASWDSNSDANQYKIAYNLDGNSFSGRYYRLLKSNSLVFMQALFKEWHDDRLIPWVHYVPVSFGMEELPEATRYLLDDPEGKAIAARIASDSRDWSRRVLRPIDLSAAYFRVFLEYGRLLDDNRDSASCC